MHKIMLKPGVRETLFIVLPLCVFTALLIVTVYLVAPVKNNGLQRAASAVLQAKYQKIFTVGDFVRTNTPLEMSTAVFELKSSGSQPYTHVALARMTGLSGPVTGVFLCSDTLPAEFAGIAGIPDSLDDPFKYGVTDSLIRFWAAKLAVICDGRNQ